MAAPLLPRLRIDHVHGPVIVAVIAMRVMEAAADKVVDVIAVRHALVPAALAVDVAWLVSCRGRGAAVGIAFGHLEAALVHVIPVHRMEAAVVQVVHVVAVPDGGVPAPLAVDVRMLRMNPVLGHGQNTVIHESEAEG